MIQQDLAATPIPVAASLPSSQPAPAHDAPVLQAFPVQFHGMARDYFGIWLVNVLMTVITLGIWSAWAQVRTNRWFYGHTLINGHAFEYHATPLQILKGRLIAIALIAVISVASYVSPRLYVLLLVLIIVAMPWAINTGLRFSACMTSWSNVRFDFYGRYWRAFAVFLLLPIIAMATFGLLAPLHSKLQGRYLADGYRYGGASFACAPRLSELYRALCRSALLVIAVAAPGFLAAYLLSMSAGIPFTWESLLWAFVFGASYIVWPAILGVYAALFVGGLYYGACVRNEIYSQTTIQGGHRLQSLLSPLRYVWIVMSGFLATAVTLTLAYPWARVRQHRYLAQSTTLLAAPGLDAFVSRRRRAPGSFGGEFSELEGFASAASI
ncbi:YjgN family protein [Achromobacter sp. NPDC058515]|uniref:YjgN family protein n=1 Tax=Achromobacter sp. NPDC058515 TaxID=3346533 RepID=UPI0036500367